MKKKQNIESKLPKTDGMTVPDGYFADFQARMASMLDDRPELAGMLKADAPRTTWQRLRPYVYMAAMFAGVWLMLKMFTMITASDPMSLDNDPVVAEALSNDTFVNEYVISDLNQWDLYDDLMEDGFSLDSIAFAEMDVPVEYLDYQ